MGLATINKGLIAINMELKAINMGLVAINMELKAINLGLTVVNMGFKATNRKRIPKNPKRIHINLAFNFISEVNYL